MDPIVKILQAYLPRIFKGCHFCYFGAAAAGAHGAYSIIAGGLVLIAIIAFVLHIELE
jgi:hypothetical protein